MLLPFLYWTCREGLISFINIKHCFVYALWQKCPDGVVWMLKAWEAFNVLWRSVKVVWIEHLVSNLGINQFLQVFGPALGLCLVPVLHSLSYFPVSRASRASRGWFIAWCNSFYSLCWSSAITLASVGLKWQQWFKMPLKGFLFVLRMVEKGVAIQRFRKGAAWYVCSVTLLGSFCLYKTSLPTVGTWCGCIHARPPCQCYPSAQHWQIPLPVLLWMWEKVLQSWRVRRGNASCCHVVWLMPYNRCKCP